MDIDTKAIALHKQFQGKLETASKITISDKEILSLAYTPGVAAVSREIVQDVRRAKTLTLSGRTIAVVTDGSAVLGLGNIGPEAALPVMEGKAVLFKQFGGLDAFPLCLRTQDPNEIIQIVKNIAPTFAGINLEDISAPRCFAIEEALMDIGIPVMHDDQHGTAIVVLAALLNGAKVVKKRLQDMKVVISGAGAAGMAIARLLVCLSFEQGVCTPVKDLLLLDSKGIIHKERTDLNVYKKEITKYTNKKNLTGNLKTALQGADVFIGVSRANLLTAREISSMNNDAIVIAMANPTPEIMPDEAKKGGALVVGTGRSDYPNQVNNLLAFPGVFKGAILANAKSITNSMKIAAAYAIANSISTPSADYIIPSVFDKQLTDTVAKAVLQAAL